MSNTFELLGRERKAATIAQTLEEYGITVAEAEAASESDWELAAKAACVKLPSVETRSIVIQMMKSREATHAS